VAGSIPTSAQITHSTIAYNRANAAGGGVFVGLNGHCYLSDTMIARNLFSATSANDITGLLGSSIDARFSLISDNAGSGFDPPIDGLSDASGNLIGANPLLGPLADNGSFTLPDAVIFRRMRFYPAVRRSTPVIRARWRGSMVYQ
jgi:hypothetical protein